MTPRSPDEAALLAGVWAAPHDDLPRLVYADWLDEHGDAPRAEFIRLQIDRAAREAVGDDVTPEAEWREEELCAAHGSDWSNADGMNWGSDPPPPSTFQRGFFGATWSISTLFPEGERPPAGRPWLARVDIGWATPGGLADIDIAAAVWGAREVKFDPDEPWTAADFAALAAAGRHLRNVTRLELFGDAGPELLLPWAEQLSFEQVHGLKLCSYRPGVDLVPHRTSYFGYRKSSFLRASATRKVQTILACA